MAPGHNEKWVEEAEPTPLIMTFLWESRMKISEKLKITSEFKTS